MRVCNKSIGVNHFKDKTTFWTHIKESEFRKQRFLETVSGGNHDEKVIGYETVGKRWIYSSIQGWIKILEVSKPDKTKENLLCLRAINVVYLKSIRQFLLLATDQPEWRNTKFLILLDIDDHSKGKIIASWKSRVNSLYAPRWMLDMYPSSCKNEGEIEDKVILISGFLKARIIKVKTHEDLKNLDLSFPKEGEYFKKKTIVITEPDLMGEIQDLCFIPQSWKYDLVIALHQKSVQDMRFLFYSIKGNGDWFYLSPSNIHLKIKYPYSQTHYLKQIEILYSPYHSSSLLVTAKAIPTTAYYRTKLCITMIDFGVTLSNFMKDSFQIKFGSSRKIIPFEDETYEKRIHQLISCGFSSYSYYVSCIALDSIHEFMNIEQYCELVDLLINEDEEKVEFNNRKISKIGSSSFLSIAVSSKAKRLSGNCYLRFLRIKNILKKDITDGQTIVSLDESFKTYGNFCYLQIKDSHKRKIEKSKSNNHNFVTSTLRGNLSTSNSSSQTCLNLKPKFSFLKLNGSSKMKIVKVKHSGDH